MRIVGLETSTHVGSVALLDRGEVIARAEHDQPNAHGENMLPLLERLFAAAGWSHGSVDRVAVGIGPGSFTGLRVGIALAQGLALGWGRPAIGVGSLRAMAHAVPAHRPGWRVPVLDARRGEVFTAVYTAEGRPVLAPCAIPRDALLSKLGEVVSGHPWLLVGVDAEYLAGAGPIHRSAESDRPSAASVACLATGEAAELEEALPLYIREADAVLPNLPPSPFDNLSRP